MTYILLTANRHLTKFHRTPGAVSHHTETTGVSPDSIHRIVGPFLRGPRPTSVVYVRMGNRATEICQSECNMYKNITESEFKYTTCTANTAIKVVKCCTTAQERPVQKPLLLSACRAVN